MQSMTKQAEGTVAVQDCNGDCLEKIRREWQELDNSIGKYGPKVIFPVAAELIHALTHEVMVFGQTPNAEQPPQAYIADTLRKARGHIRRAHLDFLKSKSLKIQQKLWRSRKNAASEYLDFTFRLLQCRKHEFKNVGYDDIGASLLCFQKLLNDFGQTDDKYSKNAHAHQPWLDEVTISDESLGRVKYLFYLDILYSTLSMHRDTALDVEIINLYLTNQLHERVPLLIHILQLFILVKIRYDLYPSADWKTYLTKNTAWNDDVEDKVRRTHEYGGHLPSVLYDAIVENQKKAALPIQPQPSAIRDVELVFQAVLQYIHADCGGCPLPGGNKCCTHTPVHFV